MRKGDQTEKKIIDVALQLFVLKGYHGTSINDITKKVGVTKGALYSHFTSKSELLHKILEIYRTDYFDKLVETVNNFEGDALAKLNQLINYKADFATRNPDLAKEKVSKMIAADIADAAGSLIKILDLCKKNLERFR